MNARTVQLTGTGLVAVVAVVAIGAALVWLYRNRALFNPLNQNNLANQGASALVKDVTGGAAAGGEDSVGGVAARFREWVTGDDARIRDMLKGTQPADRNVVTPAEQYPSGA